MSADPETVNVDRALAHLIPFFFDNRRERLKEALVFCDNGDLTALRGVGHDFKGACGSYGFHRLAAMGSELYEVKDADRARELILAMLTHLEAVRVEFV